MCVSFYRWEILGNLQSISTCCSNFVENKFSTDKSHWGACGSVDPFNILLRVEYLDTRAPKEGSRRFHNHGEVPYKSLLLVESAY